MRKITFVLSMLLGAILLASFSANTSKVNINKLNILPDDKGEQIFISKGCMVCHTNKENSIGPNTIVIAKAYKGKRDLLIKFLNKESKPIVEPNNFAIMAANLFITKKLSDAERADLADYILNQDK